MNHSDEEAYLLDFWVKNRCPNCGRDIPDGTRVGSGKKSEGGFCSLNCYAEYYKLELSEKLKRLQTRPSSG